VSTLVPPEHLEARHITSDLSCGESALDDWLSRFALTSERSSTARTYVTHPGNDEVKGYYTLAAGSVSPDVAPDRVRRGAGLQSVPVIVLARLAVDERVQRQGVGRGLVKDALIRVASAGAIVGTRAVLVHLKDPSMASFYERFDFDASPVDDSQMFLLMKDLLAALP